MAPAGSDTGIILRAPDGTLIPANMDHVVDGHFATTVGAFGVRVRTIEHLMAAAAGLGIDNLLVEVSGEELPGLDGSARDFVELLERAGRVTLPARRHPIRIEAPIRVEDGTRWLQVVPADTFRVSYTLDHEHPAIGVQAVSLDITPKSFSEDIAPARTYGFLRTWARCGSTGSRAAARSTTPSWSASGPCSTTACGIPTSSCATRCSTWWATSSCSAGRFSGT